MPPAFHFPEDEAPPSDLVSGGWYRYHFIPNHVCGSTFHFLTTSHTSSDFGSSSDLTNRF